MRQATVLGALVLAVACAACKETTHPAQQPAPVSASHSVTAPAQAASPTVSLPAVPVLSDEESVKTAAPEWVQSFLRIRAEADRYSKQAEEAFFGRKVKLAVGERNNLMSKRYRVVELLMVSYARLHSVAFFNRSTAERVASLPVMLDLSVAETNIDGARRYLERRDWQGLQSASAEALRRLKTFEASLRQLGVQREKIPSLERLE